MKHATDPTLHSIEHLLSQIREVESLKEKKLGVFYRKSRAFLHFHEQGDSIFADVRIAGSEFTRLPCNTDRQQRALVRAIIKVTSP
ncbi:MAG: hypothetical protein ACR2PZ_12445 [Pseudomonadales bacterium]